MAVSSWASLSFVATCATCSLFITSILFDEVTQEVCNFILKILSIYKENSFFQALNIADEVYMTNWHLLPLKIQNRIPLLLMKNRQPLYLHGFRIVIADRNSFKEAANRAASMIVSFRAITHKM